MTSINAPARPALRWHGGKFRLGPWIASHFPEHRVYVEPYGGAAGVLLRKPRSYSEVYNDIDGDVVTLYRVLRDPVSAEVLARAIAMTPFSRQEFEAAYDRSDDPVERSRRLLIRSHMGFGSAGGTREHRTGFRSNVTRSRTTPAHDWRGLPGVLRSAADRLSGVVIEHDDALKVIERYDSPDTLFYVDPPYTADSRVTESACYAAEMTDEDHEVLARALRSVTGAVVISGYRSALYDSMYEGWARIERDAYANGQSGASARTEVLWLNDRATERRSSLFA